MISHNKIINLLIILTVLFFSCGSTVFASNNCTKESATQMAKILYKEVGGNLNTNSTEDYFAKFVTAAIILNNASSKSGDTMYQKLMNLTSNNYAGYAGYKNNSFESVVDSSYQSKMLYISECVLSGKFTLPKNMKLQASQSIVNRYGTVWTYTKVNTGIGSDVYFGYEGSTLSNVDVYGNTLSDTSVTYYKSLAASLMKLNYSSVNTSTVCNGVVDTSSVKGTSSSSNGSTTTKKSSNSTSASNYKKRTAKSVTPFCQTEGVLKAMYIIKIVIKIITILAPIILIITSIKSLFNTLIDNEDLKNSVKNFITKFVIAAFIFFLPELLLTGADAINKLTNSNVNIRECWDNAHN